MGGTYSAVELAQECETQQGPAALSGQVAIITGATSGVGLGVLQALAPLGATIYVAGRNKDKCEEVISNVQADSENGDIHFLEVDFANFNSIKKAVQDFKKENLPLHYLFNNAGCIVPTYTETVDKHEATLRKV
jgi:retinol dehydrogenase-12